MDSFTPDNCFLDSKSDANMIDEVSNVLAKFILGESQCHKIRLRFSDLKENFGAVTFDDIIDGSKLPIWKFSSGVTPFKDYDDTTSVPIPIKHPLFKDISHKAIISLDFPVWFNLLNSSKVVMIVAQDPMPRDREAYEGCDDAICSTTFGLHSITWRNKHNGGKRLWLLVLSLINKGYGVYITDSYKYYIQSRDGKYISPSEENISSYRSSLVSEITIVEPSIIVSFGNRAASLLENLQLDETIPPRIINLPHFSGNAQDAIKKFFDFPHDKRFSIEAQAEQFAHYIINQIDK